MNSKALFVGISFLASLCSGVAMADTTAPAPQPLTCTTLIQNGIQYTLYVQDSSFSSVSYDGHPTSRASITVTVGGRSQGSSLLDLSPYPQSCLNNCPSLELVDSRWVEDPSPDLVFTISKAANPQGVMQGQFFFRQRDQHFPAFCTLGH